MSLVHPDAALARMAARQLELVTHEQLVAVGLSRSAIAHRRRQGRLHPVFPGVYTVGSPILLPDARELAATLACGRDAMLSHRSLLDFHGLVRGGPGAAPLHVTVPHRRVRVAGIATHRSATLAETARHRGVRGTTVARALLDGAVEFTTEQLDLTVNEAHVQGLATPRDLHRLLARLPGHRGSARLRRAVERHDGPVVTRSELELLALDLVRRAGLGLPLTNHPVGPYEVDLLWPEQRLVVELDGYAAHGTRRAFERDRRKDADLQAWGYRVIRLTWRRLREEPTAVAALLATALARAGGRG